MEVYIKYILYTLFLFKIVIGKQCLCKSRIVLLVVFSSDAKIVRVRKKILRNGCV